MILVAMPPPGGDCGKERDKRKKKEREMKLGGGRPTDKDKEKKEKTPRSQPHLREERIPNINK